jgi:hypothetical protein
LVDGHSEVWSLRHKHAAQTDLIIGAMAQHGLRVASIIQRLQRQAMRVLETKGRSVDASVL